MKQWKKYFLPVLLLAAILCCCCGCGTVTSQEADAYLDEEGTDSSGGSPGECTVSIDCLTIRDNMDLLTANKTDLIPEDGMILPATTVSFAAGDSVMDILIKITKEKGIQMEFEETPAYDGGYVKGIANLYEKDCGDLSGWEFSVNDWYPNYAANNYILNDGDVVQWRYTCENGEDLKSQE